MVSVSHIRKTYGATVAVDDVSFEIASGETFGLLGPNGAGKTTTIHVLVGVLRADSGVVDINGAGDPTRADARRAIGIAPQALSLYHELTGEENLRFFGRLYGVRGAPLRERVRRAFDIANLNDHRSKRVQAYSGGMQRRLNLACALMHDPQVILLDEPTAGVDPQSRNHIFETIESLKRQGRTILYTTHYMEEAERLCDRVAILDHGKILAIDTVDGLIDRYGGLSTVTGELERPPDDPSSLPGTLEGLTLRIETPEPLQEIGRLATSGLRFRTLRVDRPNLETVFLSLTGRRLRDG